ncbi:MAG: heavy metal translocating P-type ATPase [Caldilineaceae bacterium]|nr:heavy metal translocating P-type ATPase [Caldilineaceae bacterium]MBP8107235.1 heavy metal translocating P-type ATPase [Caldilineaceae bacterium]MBP8121367.1 heavy metal translocating P-type ATPase [Caldilineaceae bacterium]MBP9070672.1 heavy metal translocating P-type ATPase [Caldilineaceae bacterium]
MLISTLLAGGVAIVAGGVAVQRSPVLVGEIRGGFPIARKRQASLLEQIKSVALDMDDQYQRFMVDRVDPFFGGTRSVALKDIVSAKETLDIGDYERQLNRYLAAAGATLGTAIVGAFYPPVLVVTLGAALYSTTLIFRNGYEAIVVERKLRMDVMGSLYFIGAYAGGYFMAGSFGLFAFYLSEKLVMITQDRSQKSLINVFSQQPRTVWLWVEGNEIEVAFESLQADDIVVLHAGQVIPVDGMIEQGNATIDQHMLTGEAQPVERAVGDRVLTSTMLVGGKIHVRVEQTGEATVAAQIGTMLNSTASFQANIVSKGEQIADDSVPPSMLVALIGLYLTGYQAMVTIFGSAIGLNIKITAPIAMLNFLNVAAHNGILVKDGRSLELLKDVDTVIFDKTGTLTLEQPNVAQIHISNGYSAEQVLAFAAAAEHRQTHPIARAILDAAAAQNLAVPIMDQAHYDLGYGLRVQVEGKLIRVGSDRYMTMENIEIPAEIQALKEAAQAQGHSLVMVGIDDKLAGAIELQPTIRPEAAEIVQNLLARGVDIYVISGDQEEPTRKLTETLGIPHYFANTLPENKAAMVEQLQSEGRSVCFVGDGINDSIALKKANVSVSLRGASTAATDTAQVVLMAQSLRQLPYLFDLAHEFDSNMKAGFAAAVGQGVVVISGALLGWVGILGGTLIWEVGLLAGLGVAMLPLRKLSQKEG